MKKTSTKLIKYCTWCGEFINDNELMCMHCGCCKFDFTERPNWDSDHPDYKEEDWRDHERELNSDREQQSHYA